MRVFMISSTYMALCGMLIEGYGANLNDGLFPFFVLLLFLHTLVSLVAALR